MRPTRPHEPRPIIGISPQELQASNLVIKRSNLSSDEGMRLGKLQALNNYLKFQLQAVTEVASDYLDKAYRKIDYLTDKITAISRENEALSEKLIRMPQLEVANVFAAYRDGDFFKDDNDLNTDDEDESITSTSPAPPGKKDTTASVKTAEEQTAEVLGDLGSLVSKVCVDVDSVDSLVSALRVLQSIDVVLSPLRALATEESSTTALSSDITYMTLLKQIEALSIAKRESEARRAEDQAKILSYDKVSKDLETQILNKNVAIKSLTDELSQCKLELESITSGFEAEKSKLLSDLKGINAINGSSSDTTTKQSLESQEGVVASPPPIEAISVEAHLKLHEQVMDYARRIEVLEYDKLHLKEKVLYFEQTLQSAKPQPSSNLFSVDKATLGNTIPNSAPTTSSKMAIGASSEVSKRSTSPFSPTIDIQSFHGDIGSYLSQIMSDLDETLNNVRLDRSSASLQGLISPMNSASSSRNHTPLKSGSFTRDSVPPAAVTFSATSSSSSYSNSHGKHSSSSSSNSTSRQQPQQQPPSSFKQHGSPTRGRPMTRLVFSSSPPPPAFTSSASFSAPASATGSAFASPQLSRSALAREISSTERSLAAESGVLAPESFNDQIQRRCAELARERDLYKQEIRRIIVESPTKEALQVIENSKLFQFVESPYIANNQKKPYL